MIKPSGPWSLDELPEERRAELLERFEEAKRGENSLPAADAIAAAKRLSDQICRMVRPERGDAK